MPKTNGTAASGSGAGTAGGTSGAGGGSKAERINPLAALGVSLHAGAEEPDGDTASNASSMMASSVNSRSRRRRRRRNNNGNGGSDNGNVNINFTGTATTDKGGKRVTNLPSLQGPAVLQRTKEAKPARLQLGLNLDVELELRARLQGDVELAFV